MSAIAAGRHKAKYVPGSMQFGLSSRGTEQVAVDLQLATGQTVTAFLSFSEAAKPYSEERLTAMGWPGPGHELVDGQLTSEIDVDISYEMWEGKEQMRVNIVGSGGRVKMKQSLDEVQRASFLQRLTGVGKPVAGGAPIKKSDIPF